MLVGSNSGRGTVLDAGGNGDRLTGGSNGGDYFVGGSGNETLTGGNAVGTDYLFLGSGFDSVILSGTSIADTGSGYANIVSAGAARVFGGTGHADSFSATSGTLDVYGYRPGIDRIVVGVASTSHRGGNTIPASERRRADHAARCRLGLRRPVAVPFSRTARPSASAGR